MKPGNAVEGTLAVVGEWIVTVVTFAYTCVPVREVILEVADSRTVC
jgi:hypothetical protein